MATSVIHHAVPRRSIFASDGARRLALEYTVPAVLLSSAAIVTGLHWDISWHRSVGRDTFWTAPHVLEQVAAAITGLLCGWRVLYTSFFGTDADRANAVSFWKIFYAPLGAWVCIWGTIAMITSAPFDDWWHAAYGLDVEILTPPHVFLLLGMITIQLGAMLMMLAEQNRSTERTGRTGLLLSVSMGLVVLMAATMFYSDTGLPNMQHAPKFFTITGIAFPLFLVPVARAGKLRWPATVTAITYMVVLMVSSWVLLQVPATPKLAPIYNQITHLVPPGPPMLLVFPAIAFDLLMQKFGRGRDWTLSLVLGISFVAVLFLVQWPMASFLLSLKQPNPWFAIGYWDYGSALGPWTTQFFDVPGIVVKQGGAVGTIQPGAVAISLLTAAGFAAVSSRVGLWWGNWMERVKR